MATGDKPHAVCIPCPGQGHINAMLKFAKLLHCRGFHISFVHTDSTHNRILATSGPSSLDRLPDFRFETIADGLSFSESQANGQDVSAITLAMRTSLSDPFRQLLNRLNESAGPKVTCIVSDTFLSFTIEIAAELGIPDLSFCSVSACGFWGCFHYKELVDRGIVPLKSTYFSTSD